MQLLRLQEKGRITIPRKIRKELGLKVHDELILELRGNAVLLRPKNYVRLSDLKGVLKVKVKLEEIEEAPAHE